MFGKTKEKNLLVYAFDLGKNELKPVVAKKMLAGLTACLLLLSMLFVPQALAEGEVDTFLLTVEGEADEIEQASNDPFGLTVTALDLSFAEVVDYTGTITFESSDPDATLPGDYTFSESDQGEVDFDLSFTLVNTGEQSITVSDTEDPLVFGEITITVTGEEAPTTSADTPVILIPSDGEVLNAAEVDVVGTAPANTEVSIFDGTILKGTVETDGDGNFTFTTEPLFDGTHTFMVQATVEGETLSSEEIRVTVDTTAPVIQDITLSPEEATPGERVEIEVETEESLDELKAIVDQRTVTLTEGSIPGTYEGSFIAPSEAGDYQVDLEITDLGGNTETYQDQATLTVEVAEEPVENVAPTVSATANPTAGVAPLTVSFTSLANDTDGSVANYSWNFGDGTAMSTEISPSHTYEYAGVYSATVTVTDDGGETAMTTVAINVSEPVVETPPETVDNGPGAWALTIVLALGLAYVYNRKYLGQE